MIELVIDGRVKDLGGFSVGQVLPVVKRRMVGPFIFGAGRPAGAHRAELPYKKGPRR